MRRDILKPSPALVEFFAPSYLKNVVAITGVGKTHLAVALAEAGIQAGQAAYFMTAHDLVTDLGRAYREGRLDRRLRIYLAPKVLVIDEMGYLPLDDLGATIFLPVGECAVRAGEHRFDIE
jgi:DNA replication protein DnaC